MEREVNEEKRNKFIENAGKRVNNVLHDIQILEPMARSNTYDFTKKDIEEMFSAMEETLKEAKEEFYKKFEEKQKAVKKVFSFGSSKLTVEPVEEIVEEQVQNIEDINEMESTEETEQIEE